MSSVKILRDDINSRITSADARVFKPRVVVLEMQVLDPPTPSNIELRRLAAKLPAPQEWHEEDDTGLYD